MPRGLCYTLSLLLLTKLSYAQYFISGQIVDAQSHEPLGGASIIVRQRGTQASAVGYFTLRLKSDDRFIQVTMVGYRSQRIVIKSDTTVTILLQPIPQQLASVMVKASRPIESEFGKVSIPIERLLAVPALAGERDLIRALTILPGVVAGNEAQASLFVRGGGSDQNLFVLDGAYLYNTGHLFNFLSIFNPDAIQQVEVYKGSFPAEYGGRLSSVVDVSMREGNKTTYQGKVDVGLISSKFRLEGPIGSSKTSFIVTGRASYINLLTIGHRQAFLNGDRSSYVGFQLSDFSAKITHAINSRHKFFGSYYQSGDRYEVGNNVGSLDYSRYNLTNRLTSLRYAGIFGHRWVMGISLNHTLNYSAIHNQFIQRQALYELDPKGVSTFSKYLPVDTTTTTDQSQIADWVGRVNFNYSWGNHRLTAGAESQRHRYLPYQLTDNGRTRQTELLSASESAVFLSDEFSWKERLKLQTGLRWSGFHTGPAHFARLEPRVTMSFSTASGAQWSLGWGRTAQYQHALLRGADLFERLIWVPSSTQVPPQTSEQVSAGWQRSLSWRQHRYQLSLEGYYRTMHQLSMYNSVDFSRLRYLNWPQRLLSGGEGRAYGLEVLASKRDGRITGTLSYGLLWSQRRFEMLNGGEWFAFAFDRRHNLSVTAEYTFNTRWKLSGQFVYQSGRRFNLPTGRVVTNPFTPGYYVYEQYYAGKLPDAHRLDLAVVHQRQTARGRSISWTFSLYNAYAHANPFYVYVSRFERRIPGQPVLYVDHVEAISLFSIIPGISFAYSFLP